MILRDEDVWFGAKDRYVVPERTFRTVAGAAVLAGAAGAAAAARGAFVAAGRAAPLPAVAPDTADANSRFAACEES